MAVVKAALLLFLCWISVAERQDMQSGVLFEKKGTLHIATGSWNLVVSLDTQPLLEQIRGLRRSGHDMQKAVKTLLQFETSWKDSSASTETMEKLVEGLVDMWVKEFRYFVNDTDRLEEEITTISLASDQKRTGRSLIPIVGRGLSFLFGVATQKSVRKVANLARSTASEQDVIMHKEEQQLTLFNKLFKEQKMQNRALSMATNQTAQLEEDLQRTTKMMNHFPVVVTHINKLTSLSRILHANLGSCRHRVSRVGRIVSALARGQLTPGLMSDKEIKQVLNAIEEVLPEGWTLAIPSKNSNWFYYESLAVSALPASTGWHVYIPIPISFKGVLPFDLYRGVSFPLLNPKSNTSVLVELPSAYIAISKHQQQHMTLNPEDLQECLYFGDSFVCPKLATIREDKDGCMWNAFQQNLQKMRAECTHRLLTGKSVPKQLGEGMWSYAFWDETRIEVSCPGDVLPEQRTLKGNGILHVQDGCLATGDSGSFVLLGSLHGTKKIDVHLERDKVPNETRKLINQVINETKWIDSLTSSSHAKFFQMNREAIQKVLDSNDEVDVALNDLKSAWRVSHVRESSLTTTQIEFAAPGWALSGLALLMVLGLIVYKFCSNKDAKPVQVAESAALLTISSARLDSIERQINNQRDDISSLRRAVDRLQK